MTIISTRRLVTVSLLSSIVLAGCVSQGSYDQLKAENVQLQQQVSDQSAQLAAKQGEVQAAEAAKSAQAAADSAKISRLQGAIKYTVESDLLFASGSWKISPKGQEIITEITAKLAPTQQNKIVINGYTDDAPIGPDLEKLGVTSNQVLSQKRAEAVMQFLISKGMSPTKVCAVGHGESNPVASNDTPENKQKNRRVELTLGG